MNDIRGGCVTSYMVGIRPKGLNLEGKNRAFVGLGTYTEANIHLNPQTAAANERFCEPIVGYSSIIRRLPAATSDRRRGCRARSGRGARR